MMLYYSVFVVTEKGLTNALKRNYLSKSHLFHHMEFFLNRGNDMHKYRLLNIYI